MKNRLPEGWKEECLINIADVINDSVKQYEGERSYLSTGDLNGNTIDNLEKVTFNNKPSRANQNVKVNDVIFAKMKDTKKTLIINENTENIIVSTGFFVLRPKVNLDSRYLYFYLNSSKFLSIKDNLCTGATQSALNLQGFKKIKILLPPLEIQKEIVKVLEKAEKALEKRKEAIRLLDELAKSQFIELFGDPKSNPKAWNKEVIGSVVKSITAGWSANGETREKREDEKAILKVSAVTQGYFKVDEYKVIENDIEIKKYVFPEKGDLLFSRANTREMVGATCIIDKDYPDLLLPDKLWKVLFVDRVNVFYMKYILSESSIRAEFSAKSTGTSGSMYNVSMDKFKSIEIPIPDIDVQNQFADFVKQVDKLKFEMESSLKELENNFNSLIKNAFGEKKIYNF